MNRTILFCVSGLSLLVGTAQSGPLFDPFLERFQVGAYRDPVEIVLEGGFPADLLTPVQLDTVWVASARRVLSATGTEADAYLIHRLKGQLLDPPAMETWLARLDDVVDQLETGDITEAWDLDPDPLLAERTNRAIFSHLAAGRFIQAASLSIKLRDKGRELGLPDREIFVWDLRVKQLFSLAGNKPVVAGASWPSMLPLGSYDAQSAWAIWMAFCRKTGAEPLPAVMCSDKWGRHLARISRSWLKPEQLYASDLTPDFQAGLGAVMFRGTQRDAHFRKFPDPPQDNALQGLWIRGRRLQSGGDPATYEQLASRTDIRPGWRMDIWRRASELRLLKGQWDQGLENLRQALQLAAAGEGHSSTRRRLRQWNEQALVLALAQDDDATAELLWDLGQEFFQGKDREAFLVEAGHWAERLDPDSETPAPAGVGIQNQARMLVETGQAPDLAPAAELRREEFHRATGQSLWPLWIRWGITLANPEPVQGHKRKQAIIYRDALQAMLDENDPVKMESAALALIGRRLGQSEVFDRMLAQALDLDIVQASGWKTPPAPSSVPSVLPLLRGSELDRHALLGFALAAGDMRGILAVAVELEGRGLTPEEKRRFLYPLPVKGAIQTAVFEAGSDPALLLAVARNESLFEPSVRSRAGALGWMQIMPFHYEERGALFGEANWRNPGVSIRHGDHLLQENGRLYQGNPYLAVAAYNAGPEAASRWERQLGGSPTRDIYLAWIGYPETRHYVEKVLIDREIYDWIIRVESTD